MARKYRAYGIQRPLEDILPLPIIALRAPTSSDKNYELGQLWIYKTTGQIYGLANVSSGSATWSVLGPGASDVDTVQGDSGGAISPTAGNVVFAGGTNITTVGTAGPGTITFNLDDAISLATSVTSPIFTTSAADTNINAAAGQDIILKMGDAAGANKVSFQDSGSVEVFAIDSNGSFTISNLSNTGTFTTAGGTASINASSNFNTVINSGTSTGTVTIGNAAAGAITVDTSAGISLDAATASNLTVTGAADLTIASSAGGVNITSGEAASSTGVTIDATAGDGGITIDAGTGGILVGVSADCSTLSLGDVVPTSARTITIGGGTVATAIADTIDIGPDGADTDAGASKVVNINTGGVTLATLTTNIGSGAVTSGAHTINIQSGNAAGGTVATNISTGTGTKSVSIGNADANTTLNLDGVLKINNDVNAAVTINDGTSTGAVTIGAIANSGAVVIESSSTITVDNAGAIAINSTGGAISIGNDDVDQNANFATDGERTVTVGSTNGAAALVLQAGTGNITATGTFENIDSKFVVPTGVDVTWSTSPLVLLSGDAPALPTGATGTTNIMAMQEGINMEQFILGAGQTIIAPVMDATGLLVSGDLTATEGFEYNFGAALNTSRFAFTIGTSPAFFFEMKFTVADVSGAAPYMIGFRKTEANNATLTSYTDYAMIGLDAVASVGNVVLKTELNSGGTTNTNTTDAWTDGQSHTLKILVSAAGVVTYTIDGVAPSVTAAYTFDNADVVAPFFRLEHQAGAPGEVHWETMKIGFQ